MFGFNINDFRSSLNKYGGTAAVSDFQIIIPHELALALGGLDLFGGGGGFGGFLTELQNLPNRFLNIASNPLEALTTLGQMSSRDLRFFAESASIPGVQLQTSEVRHEGYGLFQKRPYQTIMTDVDVTFLEDGAGKSLALFHNWIRKISNFSTNRGNQTFAYPDSYKCDIIILQYDSAGNMIYGVTLLDAFPTTVTPVNLNWNSQNEPARFTVSFSYVSWNSLETLGIFL